MSTPERLDARATAAALRDGVVARATTRDVVLVTGPDARSYLQGQCSQDLDGLALGESADALLLSAQGKLDALVRVVAVGDEQLLVEVAPGYGEAVLERLARFKIRVKATLELVSWPALELRGPLAAERAPAPRASATGYVAAVRLRALFGVDLVGEELAGAKALPLGDDEAFEAQRIEAGIPAMGTELTGATIPQEAGIVAETVSFTKGCYTGQELVARIDARGNRVPRLLRAIRFEPGALRPAVGASLFELEAPPAAPAALVAGKRASGEVADAEGEKSLGALTSVAATGDGRLVGLAYVRRAVEVPARLALLGPDGSRVAVEVEELPGAASVGS